MPRFDIAIVGGGIVGIATALTLVRRDRPLSVVVLEKEAGIASHQTGHNSGVVHAGLYYKPGSLKATLCARGRELLVRFCEEHQVPFERCGKLVVATRTDELSRLDELERRGRANGLGGIRRIAKEEIGNYEPHAAGISALVVPETGIVDFVQVAHAYSRVAKGRGAEIVMDARVEGVRRDGADLVVETTAGPFSCGMVVNCAGLHADRIARACGASPTVAIIPFRGEYYELVPERRHLVRNLIYPVPDPRFPFLGVHFTRRIDGGIEAGPNAVLALAREGYTRARTSAKDLAGMIGFPGFWRMARRYYATGIAEMWRSFSRRAFADALRRLLPDVRPEDLRPAGAGVRAQAVDRSGALLDDFCIEEAPGFVHVLNAPSPAATASLAIAEVIAGRALAQHCDV